eukprot:gb/GECG01011758.1/.p1 GENE.gb/GECG01011758.1/~~gb/GECG01011758.1/.p1  ORF type:complete len:204 (+),score=16.37 gb/GECG01011758.1/:1-612(+)
MASAEIRAMEAFAPSCATRVRYVRLSCASSRIESTWYCGYAACKCNPDPRILETLNSLGASFDCASLAEIEQARQCGIPSEKIVYANPVKQTSELQAARERQVNLTVVDNEPEVEKLARFHPECKVLYPPRSTSQSLSLTVDDGAGVGAISGGRCQELASLIGQIRSSDSQCPGNSAQSQRTRSENHWSKLPCWKWVLGCEHL